MTCQEVKMVNSILYINKQDENNVGSKDCKYKILQLKTGQTLNIVLLYTFHQCCVDLTKTRQVAFTYQMALILINLDVIILIILNPIYTSKQEGHDGPGSLTRVA